MMKPWINSSGSYNKSKLLIFYTMDIIFYPFFYWKFCSNNGYDLTNKIDTLKTEPVKNMQI